MMNEEKKKEPVPTKHNHTEHKLEHSAKKENTTTKEYYLHFFRKYGICYEQHVRYLEIAVLPPDEDH